MTVLLPSELKSKTGKVLDAAKREPQYVQRDGVLLVITKADLTAEDGLLDVKRRNRIWRELDDAEGW